MAPTLAELGLSRLLLLMHLMAAPIAASIDITERSNPGGIIRVSLANLSNPTGILSSTARNCDLTTACDPYFIVKLGTTWNRDDLLSSTTDVWQNHNSLPFEFFNQTVVFNNSLPASVYLRVVVKDSQMTGDQLIADFDQEVRLRGAEGPKKFRLYSTPSNKFVSLTVQVSVSCSKFYFGPSCSKFCRARKLVSVCRPDGSLACLDGTIDCMRSITEKPSVPMAAVERVEVPRALVYWVIPSVCFGLLLTVLIGLLVRLTRNRSDSIIVRATHEDPNLESGGPPSPLDPQQQPYRYEPRQMPDGFDILSTPALLLAPADNQRFRNPVYSALRAGTTRSNAGGHSYSVTTQSLVLTPEPTGVSPSIVKAPKFDDGGEADDDDATDSSVDSNDAYEDLDAAMQEFDDRAAAAGGQPLSPNEVGRALPEPGADD